MWISIFLDNLGRLRQPTLRPNKPQSLFGHGFPEIQLSNPRTVRRAREGKYRVRESYNFPLRNPRLTESYCALFAASIQKTYRAGTCA